MACRTVMRSVFLTEHWRSFYRDRSCFAAPSLGTVTLYRHMQSVECRIIRARDIHAAARRVQVYCSSDDTSSYFSFQDDQGPPQEAVLKAISEVSKTEGRIGQTTNVVIGGTVSDDSSNEWLILDKQVNSYPTVRGFTAIGTGGEDFVHAMVVAVESVIQQPIPLGDVKQKISSRGKYISVNIGPVHVVSSEQVQAVYNAMRRDVRMKYFL